MQLKLSSVSKKFDHKIILDQASFTFEKGRFMVFWGEMVLVRRPCSTVLPAI